MVQEDISRNTKPYQVLNGNVLKLIAIIAMTVDHIAWAVFPGYSNEPLAIIMHIIGRITCPIMCFFIAEGYHYTKDIKKYTARLFIFAFISHFAYLFASNNFVDWKSFIPFYYGDGFSRFLNQTSVMWSLAFGLVMLRVCDSKNLKTWMKIALILLICVITFPADWSCIGALMILGIGTNRGHFWKQMFWMVFYVALYAIVYFFAISPVYGLLQLSVVLSIPFLLCYNGQRGKNKTINKTLKWVFYYYYPIHLAIIGLVVLLCK